MNYVHTNDISIFVFTYTLVGKMNLYKTNMVQKSQRVEHNMSPHEGRFFAPITSSSNGARDFSGRVPVQLHGTGGAEAYSVRYIHIAVLCCFISSSVREPQMFIPV